jgi:hypothetical protein
MSDALLDTPEGLREQAERCRWLGRRTIDPEVVRTLLDMADQLEGRAEQQDDPRDLG